MSQQPPDEEFERRLRDVFRSRGLGVPVSPDALDRIHSGARRRQQRRTATSVTAAFLVLAITGIGIAVRTVNREGHGQSAAAASLHTPSPTVSTLLSGTPSPLASTAPPAVRSSLSVASASGSVVASTPPTNVFNPVSVSAVSPNDYWVLGYTSSSDGGIATTVMQTTDAGQHFTPVASPPAFVAQSPAKLAPGASTVTDVRFGDTKTGWVFGSALFSTDDGGASWSRIAAIPGPIIDLVASNGTAWAIVQTASSNSTSSSAVSNQYALWSTSYGKSSQAWSQVGLPIDLGSTVPSIVDQDGTVTIMASGPTRASNNGHVLIAAPGKPFTDHTGPCTQEGIHGLSNSAKAVWASCPADTGQQLALSTDRGATWKAVPLTSTLPDTDGAGLGAIDDHNAVVYDASISGLLRVSADSSILEGLTDIASGGVSFIGFTTPAAGFAITESTLGGARLQRTSDGGHTWAVVTF